MAALEAEHRRQGTTRQSRPNQTNDDMSPSTEASHDPAATRHEPETETERVLEKSKYETTQPFRPPRGNRFS